jgi:predicted nuclease with RNAse H fold
MQDNSMNIKIIGIDLAGKSENPTGICFLDSQKLNLTTLFEDDEILSYINRASPSLIVIDAPLSLPKGRCCLSNECSCSKKGGHFRVAEVEMRKYGRTLPLTFRGMRMLTERGIKLANELKKKYTVLESHSRTVQKILGFSNLYDDLIQYFELPENINEHELDAVLLVIAGIFYMQKEFMEFGDREEGIIILPKETGDLKEVLNYKYTKPI